jgi:hypothetical protein
MALAALVCLPDVFYYVHYRTPSLIAREGFAQWKFVSAAKFGWLFIDPNGGLLASAPGILFLLLIAAGCAIPRALRERDAWGLGLLACALLGMLASTCQRNWNHPTFGISRYALYAIAPLLLFVGYELGRLRWPAWRFVVIGALACGLQLIVHRAYGLFDYQGEDSGHHSPFARYVLDHWPRLYSPPPEIFCERTVSHCQQNLDTGLPAAKNYPVIYFDENHTPRKVLAADCQLEPVLSAWLWSQHQRERIRAQLAKCHGNGPVYLDP